MKDEEVEEEEDEPDRDILEGRFTMVEWEEPLLVQLEVGGVGGWKVWQ